MQVQHELSAPQARKLVLHSQRLLSSQRNGNALSASLAALEHLGYIQIDTISVIARAHHHTLWNRNPRYHPDHIAQLMTDKSVFEYWSHAAAYLPIRDYRHSLPRKQALKTGQQNHWYKRDERLMRYVYDRINAEGPLMAKDFAHTGGKITDWGSKPAKQALEYLFMQGDLMVPHRQNFHKVYELTERVLPDDLETSMPTPTEHARFLITRFLNAHGLAQANDFSYLLKGVKPAIAQTLKQMLGDSELVLINVGEQAYYALPESLNLLNKPLSHRKAKILSPFDNLVIQRQRMRDLFNFDYQIECYVTAAKRRYGYFCLPILWDGRLVARLDCKAERKTGILKIHSLFLEPTLRKTEDFLAAMHDELQQFMAFNDCKEIDKSLDTALKSLL